MKSVKHVYLFIFFWYNFSKTILF